MSKPVRGGQRAAITPRRRPARVIGALSRAATLVATISVLGLAPAGEPAATERSPCSSEGHRQFDFWLGEWDVRTSEGKLAGTNAITRILGGCALEERWSGAGGSTGTSINFYRASDDSWHQTWVDAQGMTLMLAGGLRGRAMVLSGDVPQADGSTALHEISWTPLEDGRVRQLWRVSRDGGSSWTDLFVGLYSRR